jgi:mannan endo-1,4-beta-mannosidase
MNTISLSRMAALFALVPSFTSAQTPSGVPCNVESSPAARQVLQYLKELPCRTERRLLIGQNLGHGDELNTDRDHRTFFKFTEKRIFGEIYAQTGRLPAMTSIDYEFNYARSPEQLLNANKALKQHWAAGALITINWSPVNPWNDGWPGDKENQGKLEQLHLKAPDSQAKTKFWAGVDRVATALADLRDSSVPVLWRPLQEMDGTWFWHGNDMADYKVLWIDIYSRLTKTHGLNNLLWVYSPTWHGGLGAYAGDAYVDVIAPTVYSNEWNEGALSNWSLDERYKEMLTRNKVMGLGEAGPPPGDHQGATGFDNRLYIAEIMKSAPELSYLVAWNDWYDGAGGEEKGGVPHYSSLPFNKHCREMFDHPWAVDRSEVDWKCMGAPNFIRNGSFELDARASRRGAHWAVWMSKYRHGSTSRVEQDAEGPGFHLVHTAEEPFEVMTLQKVPLTPGKYRISARVKTSAGSALSYLEAKEHGGPTRASEKFSTQGAWRVYEIADLEVTAQQCLLGIYTKGSAGEWVHVDDVKVERQTGN